MPYNINYSNLTSNFLVTTAVCIVCNVIYIICIVSYFIISMLYGKCIINCCMKVCVYVYKDVGTIDRRKKERTTLYILIKIVIEKKN